MAERFLKSENGRLKSVEGLTASSGATDSGKIPALDAEGKIPISMLRDVAITTMTAYETLDGGDLINVFYDVDTPKVRKASGAVSGKECDGFVIVGASAETNVDVFFEGVVSGLTDLTPGARYYLSASTPGQVTDTPPSASPNVIQYIGRAISTTEIAFEPDDAIDIV